MTRYCVDCRHYDDVPTYGGHPVKVCRARMELRRDLVTKRTRWHGKDIDPSQARALSSLCGKDGRWFEPWPTLPKEWSARVKRLLHAVFGD